jgi:hypothetical protein
MTDKKVYLLGRAGIGIGTRRGELGLRLIDLAISRAREAASSIAREILSLIVFAMSGVPSETCHFVA